MQEIHLKTCFNFNISQAKQMVECHNFLSGKGSLWLLSVHFLSKPSTSYTKIYHDHLLHWQQKQLEAESGKVNEKPFGKYHPISALHYTISSSIQQQLQSLKLVISNESILWKYVEHPVWQFSVTLVLLFRLRPRRSIWRLGTSGNEKRAQRAFRSR